ncbi:cadherin-like beta sandwich domain-containing protein [Acholeplasma hippikon]|nr:cadherin-like beta sandwich domain-containing protein [Acholeplasma hippikon]
MTVVESTTQKSSLSTEELITKIDPAYGDVRFDIYMKSIGQNRKLSAIQAGWVLPNPKTRYNEAFEEGDTLVDLGRNGKKNFFTLGGTSAYHLALADANTGAIGYEFTTDDVLIASIYIGFDSTFTNDDYFQFSLDFVGYFNAALDFTGYQEYDLSSVKVNGFETIEATADTNLKTLKVGSNELTIVNDNLYEVTLTYDESKQSLNDLVKYTLSKKQATSNLTSNKINDFKAGDEIYIDVTDDTVNTVETKRHTIIITDVLPVDTSIKSLGFNADNYFSLNQTFSPDTLNYSVTIPATRVSHGFIIKPIVTSSYATFEVKLDSQKITSQTGSYAINNLTRGNHTLEIIVHNNNLSKTYTISITQQTYDSTATLDSIAFYDQSNNTKPGNEHSSVVLNESSSSYRFDLLFIEKTVKSVSFEVSIYANDESIDGAKGNLVKDGNNFNKFKYATLIKIEKGERHTITFTVTAEDNTIYEYVYVIERELSTNTELKSVSVNEENNIFNINLVNNAYHYIIKNNDVEKIVITALGKDKEFSTVFIRMNQSIISNTIDVTNLTEGKHDFEIYVVAQDGLTVQTYPLYITKQSSDTSLSFKVRRYGQNDIILSDLDFELQGNNYVISNLPYDLSNLSFEVIATHANAKVEKTSGYGTFSQKANKITGNIQFTSTAEQTVAFVIRVTAENTNISSEYEITLTRNGAKTIDTLSELTVSNTTVQGFTKDLKPSSNLGLTVIDPQSVNETVYLEALASNLEETTKITYEYKLSTSQSYLTGQSINFERGKVYDVRITVRSEANTQSIYQFQFTVASSNHEITSIRLYDENNDEINLGYQANIYEYTINVPAKLSKVNIKTILKDEYATITTGADSNGYISLNPAGKNTIIEVYATSESKEKSKTYQITLVRGSYRTSAQLESLTVKLPTNDFMNIGFSSQTYTYNIRIDNLYEFIDLSASVKQSGETFLGGNTTYQERIFIEEGKTVTVTLIVVAEDGSTKGTYTINIKRANQDATLKEVVIDGISYDLGLFTNNILNLGNIQYHKSSFEVFIELNDPFATYTVQPSLNSNYWHLTQTGQLELVITVTAQDKETKQIYRIRLTREAASNDASLKNLVFESNEGNLLENITPVTTTNSVTYTLKVTRDVILTNIIAEANHSYAAINHAYISKTLTAGGEKLFTITVTAEDGKTVMNYYVSITQKNNDTTIQEIMINEISYDLTKQNKVYDLGQFNYSERIIDLYVLLSDETYASILLNDQVYTKQTYELKLNELSFTIRAKAEDGTLGETYTFKYVLKGMSTDNNLDRLIVRDGTTNLIEKETVLENNFTINLTKEFNGSSLYLEAKANTNLKQITQVTNLTDVTLPITSLEVEIPLVFNADGSINKTISITVKAEDGSTKLYTIQIKRGTQLSSNKDIASIDVYDLNEELIKTYTSFNQMSLTVSYQISAIKIVVNLVDAKSSVSLDSIYLLTPNQAKTIEFKVKAEDGSLSDKYVITVFRDKASNDASLKNLEVFDKDGNNLISFNKDIKHYEVKLDYTHTYVDVLYDKENTNQTVMGSLDRQTLSRGVNKLQVFVTAEDNSTVIIYTITITLVDMSNTIFSITVNGITVLVTDELVYEFSNLSFQTKEIVIEFETSPYAKKIGTGKFNVNVGLNEFTIYAESEDNQKGTEYKIRITRLAADQNTFINSLSIYDVYNKKELKTNEPLRKDLSNYTVTLDPKSTYTYVDIEVNLQSELSVVDNLGRYELIENNGLILEVIKLIVTAEDGSMRTYEIKFMKVNQTTLNNENHIIDIELIGNNGINYFEDMFDQNKVIQDKVTVPYLVNLLNLNVYLPKGATLHTNNLKTYSLVSGETLEINIQAKAEDGSVSDKTYVLTIYRELPNTNNLLDQIYINQEPLSSFNSTINSYQLKVDYLAVSKIQLSAELSDLRARIVGEGIKNIKHGLNTFDLIVYAEDGSENVYRIEIFALSYETELLELTVDGKSIDFEPNKLQYEVNIPYQQTEVVIDGRTNIFGNIIGLGTKRNLKVGENKFQIKVQSEANTFGEVYEITIIREEPNHDATLKSLVVKDTKGNILPFTQNFDPFTQEYIIMLSDKNIMTVFIEATANQETSIVYQTGLQLLEGLIDGKYHTILNVTVVSESGIENKYTISFYREVKLDDVFEIMSFNLYGNNLVNYLGTSPNSLVSFDIKTLTYELKVPYTLTSMNLEINSLGKVYGAGQKLFNIDNEIIYEVFVESISKVNRSEIYTIRITKEEVSSYNLLDNLYVNNEALLNFNPNLNNYELTIDVKETNTFILDGVTSASKVSGFGTYTLLPGKNIFPINVTAENGVINTYTITVFYVDSNALLESLRIKESNEAIYNELTAKQTENFIFSPETFEYTIYVSPDTRYINISGSAKNIAGAKVLGFGTYRLNLETEKINVQVTAEDGKTTEVYSITFIKRIILANDAKLQLLVIDGYQLAFDRDTYQYKLNVSNDVNQLSVYAKTNSDLAKVSVVGYEIGNPSSILALEIDDLVEGNNVLLIKVEAQDGTISYYRLNVLKEKQENLIVVVLLIIAIILWAITVLALLIKRINRNKNDRKERMIV